MPSIFPGMNPYLEAPALWPEVHSWLIVELARCLNPLITPKYRAAVEKRVYEQAILVGIPDVAITEKTPPAATDWPREHPTATATLSQPVLVELPQSEPIHERYLEIREVATGDVVTVIEVLSTTNKRVGEGRDKYLSKRTKILSSQSHLVEIDLLRSGEPLPINPKQISDYGVLVSRCEQRPIAQLYPFQLRDPFPCFLMPLRVGDEEPVVDLNQVMQQVYEAAALDLAIAYDQHPNPPLNPEDWQWVQTQTLENKNST